MLLRLELLSILSVEHWETAGNNECPWQLEWSADDVFDKEEYKLCWRLLLDVWEGEQWQLKHLQVELEFTKEDGSEI